MSLSPSNNFRMCSRCVLDTSATEIKFDEKGICNFCYEFMKKEKERQAAKVHPGREWTVYEMKKAGEGRKYDAIIGLSGGVDSAMCLHYLVAEQGLRVLCFNVDNCWNDKKADENILRMVEKLKVPFYRYVIDLKEFSDLQIAFVRAGVKNIEIPTDHVLQAVSYKMAIENGIKYIVNGGNLATEGVMPESFGYQPRDLRHIKAIFKKFMGRKLKNLPTISLPQYLYYRFVKGIKIIQPLDFYEYHRENSKKLLAQEYGWKDYHLKHEESIYTKWFQNFYLPVKFGIDKRKAHFSSMINSGQMTRDQALEELKKPPVYPKLGCEEKVLSYPKHDYKDYPTNEWIWSLLSKVYSKVKYGNS